MNFQLTQADEADKGFLLELRLVTMATYLQQAGLPLSEQEHAQRIEHQFEQCYLIICSGKRVGQVKYQITEQALDLVQVQILPSAQGQGLGRAVMEHLIRLAQTARPTCSLKGIEK